MCEAGESPSSELFSPESINARFDDGMDRRAAGGAALYPAANVANAARAASRPLRTAISSVAG